MLIYRMRAFSIHHINSISSLTFDVVPEELDVVLCPEPDCPAEVDGPAEPEGPASACSWDWLLTWPIFDSGGFLKEYENASPRFNDPLLTFKNILY